MVTGLTPAWGARDRSVRFNRITAEDGLPSAEVRQVLQDRFGFIWLAMDVGLVRYDGGNFVTYQHRSDDASSLAHSYVFSILETADGLLWAGTDGGGLSVFNPMAGSFVSFQRREGDSTSLPNDHVRALVEGPEGEVWLGTDGGGVAVLDRATKRFKAFRNDPRNPRSLASDHVRDIVWARDGRLWVATLDGLSVLDPMTGHFTNYQPGPDDPSSSSAASVRRVYEDRAGQIWAGMSARGLYRFDRAAGRFEKVNLLPADEATRSTESVATIFEDSAGTLWVGTAAGLFERPRGEVRFRHRRSDVADWRSIPNPSVRALFEDRGGVLWVGTRGGLATWNVRSGSFSHYFRSSERPGELSDNWVNAFAEGPDGEVWVGTLNGLNRFDRDRGSFEQFRYSAADSSSLSDDRVMSLLVDRQGVLWVGTQFGGLNRYDTATGGFRSFTSVKADPSTVGSNGITSLYEDRDGVFWVGTFGGGLNRMDREKGTFERFLHDPEDPLTLSSDRLLSIHEDGDGVLWVGTAKSGINRFDRSRRTFTRYRHDASDRQSLSSDAAWWITSDSAGNLWIATQDGGVNRWSAEDRRRDRPSFRRITSTEGLPSDLVYTIVEAQNGDLWMSTGAGLARFHPDTAAFTIYDTTHGLQEEFNQAAAGRTKNGDLFFGGTQGFNVVAQAGLETNTHVPPIVLTDFLKFNESVALGLPAHQVDEISLGYKDAVIAFEFAALDYTAPGSNQYEYRLEPFDQTWVSAGKSRRATYTNLDPGRYRFKVRGSNNDGVWNEEGIEVGVLITPPPWRSWWAQSLYVLAGGCLALLATGFVRRRGQRSRELRRMNVSLQHEVEVRREKERALEAEKLKAREYLDVAEVVMVAIDRHGRVKLINQKGCRLLGREESDIVGREWVEDFVPEDRRKEVSAILSNIENHIYCEYPLVTDDGAERIIAWHSTQLPSTDEGWVILSSGTDNTEIHALEKQVRAQQKMDALGTLAGGIAHDFNNILTAVLGYSTLTLSLLEQDSEEAGYLKHVVKGCERASDMVARILTFSRREDSDKRPTKLGPIVQETCDLLRSTLPASVEIRTRIESEIEPIIGDPSQIHQVLMNLGTNAAHAMPNGGVLEVRLDSEDVGPFSAVIESGVRRRSYARISVVDSGVGMDKATLQRVFEPFFTTKEVGSGTGLGLSVAHGIIKGHQGDISVQSTPGIGTTVVVRLPCYDVAVADEKAGEFVIGGAERVLLVDDEKPIVLLAKKWLEDLGYSVEPHTSAVEALAAFRASPGRFDILVADHNMPELAGLDLIREARKLEDVPVVLSSGRDLSSESQAAGCVWLQKPFKAADLAACVRAALLAGGSVPSVSPRRSEQSGSRGWVSSGDAG